MCPSITVGEFADRYAAAAARGAFCSWSQDWNIKIARDLAVIFRTRLSADVTVASARSDRPPSYDFPADVPLRSHRARSLLAYFVRLCRLRALRPDFVISSWAQDNVLVTLAFLFSRSRVILVEHSSWNFHGPGVRLLRRLVYPFAWAVVVLNRRDLEHHRRYLRNVRLIPNPVIANSAQRRGPPREKLVLAVGHLLPIKQFDHAVHAMAQSGLEQHGWSLAIIGSGSEETSLRRLIAELGLERTQIHAQVGDLGSWYARASLLLVTSSLESFSLVLAEAMLSGVVPIAYASDGPSFILEGFPEHLVATGDVPELAARMTRFADERELEILRGRLRASIETRFAPDGVADQWAELLR